MYFWKSLLGESPSSRMRLACCCLRVASSLRETIRVMIQRLAASTRSSDSLFDAYFLLRRVVALSTCSLEESSEMPRTLYMRVHSRGESRCSGGGVDPVSLPSKPAAAAWGNVRASASVRAVAPHNAAGPAPLGAVEGAGRRKAEGAAATNAVAASSARVARVRSGRRPGLARATRLFPMAAGAAVAVHGRFALLQNTCCRFDT
mmetsp:Transcript_7413/g.16951  ORF Transcript_7413/g.16951 Transcript_7413/m.16951 type:complete len:204 (+) Transcript_7413:531-1142(+)